MFIAISGTECSGRNTLLEYLVKNHGFNPLYLKTVPERDQHLLGSTESPTQSLPNGTAPNRMELESIDEMLDYVTRDWRSNYVTTHLDTHTKLDLFSKRPFTLIISVDAPIHIRFGRLKSLRGAQSETLEQFIERHDMLLFGQSDDGTRSDDSLVGLQKLANIHIINGYATIAAFHSHLESMDLLNGDRLRPHWDTYFMMLASLAAQRSNCMKRRVGAILVRNSRILATGYNGTARGLLNCNEGGCARCNRLASSGTALDECLCLHAEENALLEAGRERIGDGSVLYCNTCPCLRCSVKIVQIGVKEVVYNLSYKVDAASAEVFRQAGVKLRRHLPPS